MVQLRSVCQIGHIGKNIDEVGSDFATTCCICVGDQTPTIVCLAQIFQEKRDVTIPLSYGEKHSRHRRHRVIDGKYYFSEGSQTRKVSLHKKATLARLTPASKTFYYLKGICPRENSWVQQWQNCKTSGVHGRSERPPKKTNVHHCH